MAAHDATAALPRAIAEIVRVEVDRRVVEALTGRAAANEVLAEELARLLPAQAPAALVTTAEYARRSSISTSTVRAAIREGRLEVTRIGRAVRIAADARIRTSPVEIADVTESARRQPLRGR